MEGFEEEVFGVLKNDYEFLRKMQSRQGAQHMQRQSGDTLVGREAGGMWMPEEEEDLVFPLPATDTWGVLLCLLAWERSPKL